MGDGGSAHNLSGWIPDRGHRDQNINLAAILPLADRFERADAVAFPDGLEAAAHFVAAARRSENGNVLSEDFLG